MTIDTREERPRRMSNIASSMVTSTQVPVATIVGVTLALLLFIIVPFLFWGNAVEEWTVRQLETAAPLAAAFTGGGLLALDIFLPVPSSMVGVLLGAALGFAAATFVGTVGLSVGCLIGYGHGRTTRRVLAKRLVPQSDVERSRAMLTRYGIVALAALRPVPVAEASIVAAGALGIPMPAVIVVATMANLCVSAFYAAIGSLMPIRIAAYVAAAAVLIFCAMLAATRIAGRRPA